MGQCAVAWEARQNRKLDRAIKMMQDSADKRQATCKNLETTYAGKTLQMDDMLTALKAAKLKSLRKKQTKAEKDDVKRIAVKKVLYSKRREKWGNAASAAEEAKENLIELALNKESLGEAKIMAKGFQILRSMGMDVGNADLHLDRAEDAQESIEDFNRAFAERDQDKTTLTAEELKEIDDELEEDFGDGSAIKEMPTVPLKQHSKYVSLSENEYKERHPVGAAIGEPSEAEAIELELENDA